MILAAGLGTRLRPLTDDRPKALVEVGGRTLLEITLCRLRSFGVDEVIVNAHHFSAMIVDFLKDHHNFDLKVEVSLEEDLLDTGGGLKKAAYFFGDSLQEPFILHNVDVISNIDLGIMLRFHRDSKALATLAVQQRASTRQLLFNEKDQLCGRRGGSSEESLEPQSQNRDQAQTNPISHSNSTPLAFSGIHVLSPRIFSKLEEEGAFSIISAYMRLASQGERIFAFRADDCYWRDLGRPESIHQAEMEIASGSVGGASGLFHQQGL
jgi:NDP-sugar pyrophosphorylase family protein